jgi:hypothetical protein
MEEVLADVSAGHPAQVRTERRSVQELPAIDGAIFAYPCSMDVKSLNQEPTRPALHFNFGEPPPARYFHLFTRRRKTIAAPDSSATRGVW